MTETHRGQPWLELYGARPVCPTADYSDMLSLFRAVADASADSLFYSDGVMSYRWLDERSSGLALWLAEELEVIRGSRIAIILQNVPEFVVSTVAAWKLGCVPMPLNPMYQESELARLFADGTPRAIICHEGHAKTVDAALRRAEIPPAVILTCDSQGSDSPAVLNPAGFGTGQTIHSFASAISLKQGMRSASLSVSATETGLLLYTSGTTGAPKGAVLSHGALAFNSRIALEWFSVRASARILTTAPLFHVVGFVCQMCAAFLSQGSLVLNHRFEAGKMLELIRARRPTFMIGPITAYIALMNHPAATSDHFASFDTLYAGGGPVPSTVVRQFEAQFGRRIASAYGMTETCAPTHVVPYELKAPVDEATGALSIGIPVSGADAIIERADGILADLGEPGELLIRGTHANGRLPK